MESLHVIKRGLFLATKKGLDVIETGYTKGMTLIKSRKEIPAQIVPIISHIEESKDCRARCYRHCNGEDSCISIS